MSTSPKISKHNTFGTLHEYIVRTPLIRYVGRSPLNLTAQGYKTVSLRIDPELYLWLKEQGTPSSVARNVVEEFCLAHLNDEAYMERWIANIRKDTLARTCIINPHIMGISMQLPVRVALEKLTDITYVTRNTVILLILDTMREEMTTK